jgi:ABC-type uncharacterized transport system auxiliary subunit
LINDLLVIAVPTQLAKIDRRKPLSFSNDDDGPQILFSQSYATSAPVKGEGPASLVSAWNEAFRTMLKELTADLSHNVPATTQATALR